jgi:uncharacterized protein
MQVLTKEKDSVGAPAGVRPETGSVQIMNASAVKLQREVAARPKTIWIDLENSPHVPFFKPIIEELESRGHKVILTARDCFQVCDLADLFHMNYKRIGRHYGKHKLAKMLGLGMRVLQMTPQAVFQRPDLCLSHGSRSQIIVSSALKIPNMIIFDYEHTTWVRWMIPTWVMAPEVLSEASICAKGVRKEQLLRYPGIKEDVYAPSFKPDPSLRQRLGINGTDLIVTIRPPATEAHYHNPEAETLLTAVIELLGAHPDVRVVVVPRTPKQGAELRAQFPQLFERKQVMIPDHVVDGLDLIWCSDFVISGGGTMNREAAALNVPVYSIFRGTIGAVDHYLEAQGRLVLLESVADVKSKIRIARRSKPQGHQNGDSPALKTIVQNVLNILDGMDAK